MNAKLKCKSNQMTVDSNTPLVFSNKFAPNSSKHLFHQNNSIGLLSSNSSTKVWPIGINRSDRTDQLRSDRTDQSSSTILREKLLHRHKTGSTDGSANTTKPVRKSYNRSQSNGFKFHNFVVNEDKRACLEEQHGTKKITVSHWKKPSNPQIVVNGDCEPSASNSNVGSQSILETLLAPTSTRTDQKTIRTDQKSVRTDQKSSRTDLKNIRTDLNCMRTDPKSSKTDQTGRVNKRKPLHVRRVLRHELKEEMEQEEPLDLSLKKVDLNIESEKCGIVDELRIRSNENEISMSESPTESVQHLIKSVNQSAAQASAIIASIRSSNTPNFDSNSSSNSEFHSSSAQFQVNSSANPPKSQKYRQTQRSLIKKQLEETFKQNGFLVKTKQVSDANNSAMFCKFRQLRKYTRYYLKSWHHHLPDEVNKLWKGFLPPKTEKPSSSHN